MKIETQNLSGALLDAFVDIALGHANKEGVYYAGHHGISPHWSTDWQKAGKIIEDQQISVVYHEGGYIAGTNPEIYGNKLFMYHQCHGETHLLAAMRSFVSMKLGEAVNVPTRLLCLMDAVQTSQNQAARTQQRAQLADGMTQVWVADLTEDQINWAIARHLSSGEVQIDGSLRPWLPDQSNPEDKENGAVFYEPASNPDQGNAIIEREKIQISEDPKGESSIRWMANIQGSGVPWQIGSTRLLAAMRALIRCRLGSSVLVPARLKNLPDGVCANACSI